MDLGVHVSVGWGYDKAIEHARALRCEAVQIFSYRRHHADPPEEELSRFKQDFPTSGARRLLVHVRYLPALAASDPSRRAHSAGWLAREFRLSTALGAEALVIHAGAYSENSDAASGMRHFVEGARRARDEAKAELPLWVENVPGGGRRMCGTLEEMRDLGGLLEAADFSVGFCLDTAHAFAQGYAIDSAEGISRFLDRGSSILGKSRLRAFHVNETLAPLGSHRENHWHWGEGSLGIEALRHLLVRPEFHGAVGIIETPKGERNAENYAFVRRIRV